eukprot:g39908.t1
MALQDSALAAFRQGQHDALTKFVANYEGKSLDLSSKNLGDFGASAVARGLQVNTALQVLNLYDNNIRPEGAAAIADMLKVNSTLTTLGIGDNGIGSQGAQSMADAIKVNTTLTHLLLYNNNIGPEGANHIAKALQGNEDSKLTSLNIGGNSIGPGGAKYIAEAMKVNNTVQTLNLYDNNIGPDGAKAIGKALEENKECKLQTLDILYNRIGDAGAIAIGKALQVNKSLKELSLWNNGIGPEGAKAIAAALEVNTSLENVDIKDNELEPAQEKEVTEASERQFKLNRLWKETFNTLTNGRDIQFAVKQDDSKKIDRFLGTYPPKSAFPGWQKLLEELARDGLLKAFDIIDKDPGKFNLDKHATIDYVALRTAGMGAADEATQKYFRAYGKKLYLDRYDHEEEPMYESPTCAVYLAEDLKADNAKGELTKVALKVINPDLDDAEANFDREVSSRTALDLGADAHHQKEGLVVGLVRSHKEDMCLVMPAADLSLAEFLLRRNIAGRDVLKVREIMLAIAHCLKIPHGKRLVHGDLKPRNVVRLNGRWALVDFDAAAEIGQPVGHKFSSAFAPPELATVLAEFGGSTNSKEAKAKLPKADPSFDIFSFGVILYELCTGNQILPHVTDNLTYEDDLLKLSIWQGIDKDRLAHVFQHATNKEKDAVREDKLGLDFEQICDDMKHLIWWCLQEDPELRPTLKQVLDHRALKKGGDGPQNGEPEGSDLKALFINDTKEQKAKPGSRGVTIVCDVTSKAWKSLKAKLWTMPIRTRIHFFLSHMQAEASGDVGTLAAALKSYGAAVWRDMDAINLTEEGMRQGVADCDVFILFLTNGVLSRPYCLKEIKWALEFGKPFIVVTETDLRFFPFDWLRFERDLLEKLEAGAWGYSKNLGSSFEKGSHEFRIVFDAVKEQWDSKRFIPFRRRDFEVKAMVREIITRAGQEGCAWGKRLPPKPKQQPFLSLELAPRETDLPVYWQASRQHPSPSTPKSDIKKSSAADSRSKALSPTSGMEAKQGDAPVRRWPITFVICNRDCQLGKDMCQELLLAMEERYPDLKFVTSDEATVPAALREAERVVVLLTAGILKEGSSCMTHLRYAVEKGLPMYTLYSEKQQDGWEMKGPGGETWKVLYNASASDVDSSLAHKKVTSAKPLFSNESKQQSWDFGSDECKQAPREVMEVVGSLEAMIYRPLSVSPGNKSRIRKFESDAMCDELLARMARPFFVRTSKEASAAAPSLSDASLSLSASSTSTSASST